LELGTRYLFEAIKGFLEETYMVWEIWVLKALRLLAEDCFFEGAVKKCIGYI
jgi:hypothetical protein